MHQSEGTAIGCIVGGNTGLYVTAICSLFERRGNYDAHLSLLRGSKREKPTHAPVHMYTTLRGRQRESWCIRLEGATSASGGKNKARGAIRLRWIASRTLSQWVIHRGSSRIYEPESKSQANIVDQLVEVLPTSQNLEGTLTSYFTGYKGEGRSRN